MMDEVVDEVLADVENTMENEDSRVAELKENYKRQQTFCKGTQKLLDQKRALEKKYADLRREIKALGEEIDNRLTCFISRETAKPLFEFADKKEDENNSTSDNNCDPKSSDEWRNWKVGDWFELTENQLEKMELYNDSTVGELSDLLAELSTGNKKIKGIGFAVIDKISEQFNTLWQSPEYAAIKESDAAIADPDDDSEDSEWQVDDDSEDDSELFEDETIEQIPA